MEGYNSSPQLIHVNSKIILTEKERLLFELLIKVVKHYDLKTELRVAGGWVRDKLLGMDSEDIDIALYEMKGGQFCEKIVEYLSCVVGDTTVASVIPNKSEKSKDLETAKMKLYGIYIDFVHLRSEVYYVTSRVPQTKFASPRDDAFRRDLTINSLFYNIINDSVEDFTGQGIEDLNNGRIVTTSPPQVSFLEDPLRIFRAIRFGARFGFMLDEELKRAAKTAEVKAAISGKLNQELIAHEVDLMISDKDPAKAMALIYELSLFYVVFVVPPRFEPTLLQELDRLCVTNIDVVTSMLKLLDCGAFNDGDRRLILYAALLLPLRKFTHKNKKSIEIPLVNYIFQDSLKLKAADARALVMIHTAAERFASLTPYLLSGKDIDDSEVLRIKEEFDIPSTSKLRTYAGVLSGEIKCLWRISLLVSTLLYPAPIDFGEYTNGNYDVSERKQMFTTIEDEIIKLGLREVRSSTVAEVPTEQPLIPQLNDDVAMNCLARVPRKLHPVLRCLSKRHREFIGGTEELLNIRKNYSLAETWIYTSCYQRKHVSQRSRRFFPCCYVFNPAELTWKAVKVELGRSLLCSDRFEVDGTKLFFTGGEGGRVICFDAYSNRVSLVASLCGPRHWDEQSLDFACETLVTDGHLYVPSWNKVLEYDHIQNNWNEADPKFSQGWLKGQRWAGTINGTVFLFDEDSYELISWQFKSKEWFSMGTLDGLDRQMLRRDYLKLNLTSIGNTIYIIGHSLYTVIVNIDAGQITDHRVLPRLKVHVSPLRSRNVCI